jgi:hypothetical protein
VAEVDRRRAAHLTSTVKSGRGSTFGSSSPVPAAGERRSVGSRIAGAKLRDRWRASGVDLGGTCRGKTLRAVEPVLIDESTAKAVLALLGCDSSQSERRDMGCQRRSSRALRAADNAAAGRCPRFVEARDPLPRDRVAQNRRSWRCAVKRHLQSGPNRCKAIGRPREGLATLPRVRMA